MEQPDYRDILPVLDQLNEIKTIDDLRKFHNRFSGVLQERLPKAIELLNERKVKKYVFQPSGRIQWIVVGDSRDYIIYNKVAYCSCDDFFLESMSTGNPCKHLIAQRMAENMGWYDVIKESDAMFDVLITEWRGDVFSKTERPPEENQHIPIKLFTGTLTPTVLR